MLKTVRYHLTATKAEMSVHFLCVHFINSTAFLHKEINRYLENILFRGCLEKVEDTRYDHDFVMPDPDSVSPVYINGRRFWIPQRHPRGKVQNDTLFRQPLDAIKKVKMPSGMKEIKTFLDSYDL